MTTYIVENSAAPEAIGDTLAAFPALHAKAWIEPIEVWLSSSPCRPLFSHPKAVQLEQRPDNGLVLDIQQIAPACMSKGISMTRAYLLAIGLDKEAASPRTPEIVIELGEEPKQMPYCDVLIAPFSHSDNGTGTKLWPQANWLRVAKILADNRLSVGLLGATGDDHSYLQAGSPMMFNYPLQLVAWMMKSAKLVLTVDNGMNWLAQAVQAKHVLLMASNHQAPWSANPNSNVFNLPLNSPPANVLSACAQLLQKTDATN